MDNTKQLADEIYRARVRRAREMTPEEKFLEGPRLFRMECEIAKEAIRIEYPDADEERVSAILRERLQAKREREDQELVQRMREKSSRPSHDENQDDVLTGEG